ncbi:MAG: hypothetical protein JWO92_1059 [Chitinophagaceae bacterium]|nr:hypothetical protein [Chitinophagaceae bacterium]
MKDTIFISHANPANNYFAAWLASKLKLLGYKVWVDVHDIKPGNYFNKDFEKSLRENAIRFIAVVSNDYIIKSKTDDTGVMNEILLARSIKDINGFIIPVLYDNCDYSEFTVGLVGRQAIAFNKNWADGLCELVNYFEEIEIPKYPVENNVVKFWHESQKIKAEPIDKPEKYLTNWFPVNLPEFIYVHEPDVFIEDEISVIPYANIREGNRIITFSPGENVGQHTILKSTVKLPANHFINSTSLKVDSDFQLIDPNRKLVRLVNKILRYHFIKAGMSIYEQSNRKEIFFFPFSEENKKMVNLKQLGKTRRSVMGDTTEFRWHFAISHSFSLFPSPCFKIFYHLVFTDTNGIFLKPDEQHELRRKLPNDWFNRKWLEILLAMMLKISRFDVENKIKIEVSDNIFITVDVMPIDIISSIGYNEPNDEPEVAIL